VPSRVRVQVLSRVRVQVLSRVRVLVPSRVRVLVRERAVTEAAEAGAMGLSPARWRPHSRVQHQASEFPPASSTHNLPRAELRSPRQPENAARFVCP
jgi:hypothetical protein